MKSASAAPSPSLVPTRRSAIHIACFGSLILVYLTLSLSSLIFPLRESITYDEYWYYKSGLTILSGEPSTLAKKSPQSRNIMPIVALYPLTSAALSALLPHSFTSVFSNEDRPIYFAKLASIIVSLLLAIYVYLWSHRLYGPNAGLLATSLYLLDPNIIAHSRIVHQNIFEACAIFIATYYFWCLLNFGSRRNFILSIVTLCVAFITRHTAILLLPIFFLLAVLHFSLNSTDQNAKLQVKRIIKEIAGYTTISFAAVFLIINIGFSFDKTFTKLDDYHFESSAFNSLQHNLSSFKEMPLPVPFAYVMGLDYAKYKQETGAGSGQAYLLGKLGERFNDYYVIAFLYKVPLATQLMIALGFGSLLLQGSRTSFLRNESFLVLPIVVYFTAFSLANSQIGIRYILTIFPFLFVLASRVVARDWTAMSVRFRILIGGLLIYLFASNLSYYPHYISYFNELVLDRKMGYKILADSNLDWGQNRYYLQHYLQQNPSVLFLRCSTKGRLEIEQRDQNLEIKNQPTVKAVIAVNKLLGITENPKTFELLRDEKIPVDHVAYSFLVFELKQKELAHLLDSSENCWTAEQLTIQ